MKAGRAAAGCAAAAMAVGLYWSARLAWADWEFGRGTLEGVTAAARLAPWNARYEARRGTLERRAGNLAEADRALEAAAALNPRYSAVWMEIGLRAELRKDFGAAERALLEAAKADRMYDPRWTLANYYLRRGDEKFWRWAREAAGMAYGDMRPLFALAWNFGGDRGRILERAIPERREVERQYLGFVLEQKELGLARPVWERLAGKAEEEDRGALLSYCDRLLEAGDGRGAVEVWNALAGRKLAASALDPARGPVLTNGDFGARPESRGFDWRMYAVEGAAASHAPGLLRVEFSGKQPERCEPAWQVVPVLPGKEYLVEYEFRTEGMAAESGLRWEARDWKGQQALLGRSEDLASEGWARGSFAFRAPADGDLVRVALAYQRAPGMVRIEGTAWVRRVKIGVAE